MNKAFTKESDEEPDDPAEPPRSAQLPPGTPNYTTADGVTRMRDELDQLANVESPALAREDQSSAETKRRIRRVEQRMQYLRDSLRTAMPMNPAAQAGDTVRFGTTVTVNDAAGAEYEYRIVGVDEIDLNRGCVSWLSPLAKALLNSKVGDTVTFRTPRGEEHLKIARIA